MKKKDQATIARILGASKPSKEFLVSLLNSIDERGPIVIQVDVSKALRNAIQQVRDGIEGEVK